ncbi:MAG: hypothetical protein R6T87_06235 [Marinobacter sp.]
MAEQSAPDTTDDNAASGPVLRPGRAADPVPDLPQSALPAGQRTAALPLLEDESADDAPNAGQAEFAGAGDVDEAESTASGHIEQTQAESKQRTLRLMLRQSDRVLLMDFELLAMPDWPDNYEMAAARRSRDIWVFSALVAASVFLSGLIGVIPAWIAGGGFGAFVIILLLGVPFVRRIYSGKPSYLDLVVKRQRLLKDARKHIGHLEGKEGLIWQCARMAAYNPALKHPRFSDLLRLSEQRSLVRNITRRESVRRYLIYLMEAEKAYNLVQQAFFEGNQEAIDNDWRSVAAVPVERT